jgi:hypothetical protein
MNCGIYKPYDDGRFLAYQEGMRKLKNKAELAGSKIIFITPIPYDSDGAAHAYKDVVKKYSAWLVDRRDDEWMVIDLHSHMQKALDFEKQKKPDFTYQNDNVHPNADGHWIMTQPIIRWFGDLPSSQSNSITDVINLHQLPASIEPLIRERMELKRNTWLTHTGHSRPGIKPGLSMAETKLKEKKLNREINRLIKIAGQ